MKLSLILLFTTLVTSASEAATLKELTELKPPFSLTDLPYPADSLKVAIDEQTMKIHHDKHHQAYVDKLNDATKGQSDNLLKIFRSISKKSDGIRNNGGGHFNHSFFWEILSGDKANNEIPKELSDELTKKFGSVEKFKEAFEKAGMERFGSGWAWLVRTPKGELEVTSTPNQDNTLMEGAKVKGWPILGADVWEHAYYLQYQNKRAEYLKNFWSVVNWKKVKEFDDEAKKMK